MEKNIILNLTWIDISILSAVLISSVISLARGFSREVISLITWALAFVLAFRYGATVGEPFTIISTEMIRSIVGSILVFVVVLLCGGVINYFACKVVRFSGIGILDRFVGVCFGFFRGAVVVGVIVAMLMSTSVVEQSWWKDSFLIPKLQVATNRVAQYVPNEWKESSSKWLEVFTL